MWAKSWPVWPACIVWWAVRRHRNRLLACLLLLVRGSFLFRAVSISSSIGCSTSTTGETFVCSEFLVSLQSFQLCLSLYFASLNAARWIFSFLSLSLIRRHLWIDRSTNAFFIFQCPQRTHSCALLQSGDHAFVRRSSRGQIQMWVGGKACCFSASSRRVSPFESPTSLSKMVVVDQILNFFCSAVWLESYM